MCMQKTLKGMFLGTFRYRKLNIKGMLKQKKVISCPEIKQLAPKGKLAQQKNAKKYYLFKSFLTTLQTLPAAFVESTGGIV